LGTGETPVTQKAGLSAGVYFRSLDQLAGAPRIAEEARSEFPNYNPSELTRSSRRSFMKLAGASMALAGLTMTGCRRWPREELVPYTSAPRDRVPGVPEHYASGFEIGGVTEGVVVTSYDGRPIKVEGNPDHPFSSIYGGNEKGLGRYGAAGRYAQASVLEMYDPDRSRGVVKREKGGVTLTNFEGFVDAAREALKGAPVAFLASASRSPSAAAMWKKVSAAYPNAKWYEYEPLSNDAVREGMKLAFGRVYRPVYDFKTADVAVIFDGDLLANHPASLRYSADWAERRRRADAAVGGASADKTMSRVYVCESMYTNTGAVADVRVGVTPSRVDAVVRALAAALGVAGATAGGELSEAEKKFVASAAADLKAAGKKAFVASGSHLAPETQAVVQLINASIGTSCVKFLEVPDQDRPTHLASIKQLASDLSSGAVKGVIVLGGNPVYDAPADLGMNKLIEGASFSAYFGLYENETSLMCQWHVPEAHYLESWGDGRAYDGTVTLMQPIIEPLFGGKSRAELLAALAGENEQAGRLIQRAVHGIGDETAWKKALQVGLIAGTGYPVGTPKATGTFPAAAPAPAGTGELEVRFVGSTVYDGRYANLGWLIEMPDPMTKLTWDNALVMSKKDADKLGLKTNDVAKVTVDGQGLEIPVYVLPGQPVGSAYLPLGFGRKAAGVIGNQNGMNTYELRKSSGFSVAKASVAKTGGSYELASTQDHYIHEGELTEWVAMQGYEPRVGKLHKSGKIVREATLAEFVAEPELMKDHAGERKKLSLQLWDPPHELSDYHAWGMAVDMSACTGCGACVVACQAENNIPTVGRHQVLMHRAMHWIRIDRYFKHDPKSDPDIERPEVVFQPMMCVHCENAPCEQVCPVAATVHDTEGLNTMVYNRCIGTRYCSNNCPYKVRRFNYFDYHSTSPREGLRKPWLQMPDQQQVQSVDEIKRMVYNPEVTVRMRGVMEKCTYCTQRIQTTKQSTRNKALQEASALKLEGEAFTKYVNEHSVVSDGAVLTACQQACPTQAIWFGNIADRNARVVERQKSARSYDVLAELNTRPRTKYLGKLRNPPLAATDGSGAKSEEAHG
jgi:molybdopterin-containing oxidoreductase family iron-sulfur binding subunit